MQWATSHLIPRAHLCLAYDVAHQKSYRCASPHAMSALLSHFTPFLPISAHQRVLEPSCKHVASKNMLMGNITPCLRAHPFLLPNIAHQKACGRVSPHVTSVFPGHLSPSLLVSACQRALEQACCLQKKCNGQRCALPRGLTHASHSTLPTKWHANMLPPCNECLYQAFGLAPPYLGCPRSP